MITRQDYENEVAYLKAVCRIAADRLRDGGVWPIKGETYELLNFAAGDAPPSANAQRAEEAPIDERRAWPFPLWPEGKQDG